MGIQEAIKNSEKKIKIGLKKSFLTGIAALLPAVLTIFVIVKVIEFVDRAIGRYINELIYMIFHKHIPGLGFIAAILLVLIVGFFLATFIGRKIFLFFENSLKSIPVINTIYSFVKQIIDFFLKKQEISYKKVVMVEYPRKGIYSLGLVTGNGLKDLSNHTGEEMVSVFVPTSPTPVTGYTIVVPKKDIIPIDMEVEEAVRFTISAGVIVPPTQQTSEKISED